MYNALPINRSVTVHTDIYIYTQTQTQTQAVMPTSTTTTTATATATIPHYTSLYNIFRVTTVSHPSHFFVPQLSIYQPGQRQVHPFAAR